MDTIAKKGRYFLLATAILAYLGAVGVVLNRVIQILLGRIVTENVGAVLGGYGQFTALTGAVLAGIVPCVLLLLAARHTEGLSKVGLACLAGGAGVSALLTLALFFIQYAGIVYQTNMLSAAVSGLLVIAGDILLAADRRSSGTVKGVAIAAAVFALLCMLTELGASFCGYQLVMSPDAGESPWVRVLSLVSTVSLFVSIIGSVLDGSKYMLLYAMPAVQTAEADASKGE